MQKNIYVFVNGEQKGPFDSSFLEECIRNGVYQLDALGWHEGMSDWMPLSHLIHEVPNETASVDSESSSSLAEQELQRRRYVSVGSRITPKKSEGKAGIRAWKRNLTFYNISRTKPAALFIEQDQGKLKFLFKNITAGMGGDSVSFASDFISGDNRFTIAGNRSCKIIDESGKLYGVIRANGILRSWTLTKKLTLPIIVFICYSAFLYSVVAKLLAGEIDIRDIPTLYFIGGLMTWGGYARWLIMKKIYCADVPNSPKHFEAYFPALFSKSKLKIYANREDLGIIRSISSKEKDSLLGIPEINSNQQTESNNVFFKEFSRSIDLNRDVTEHEEIMLAALCYLVFVSIDE